LPATLRYPLPLRYLLPLFRVTRDLNSARCVPLVFSLRLLRAVRYRYYAVRCRRVALLFTRCLPFTLVVWVMVRITRALPLRYVTALPLRCCRCPLPVTMRCRDDLVLLPRCRCRSVTCLRCVCWKYVVAVVALPLLPLPRWVMRYFRVAIIRWLLRCRLFLVVVVIIYVAMRRGCCRVRLLLVIAFDAVPLRYYAEVPGYLPFRWMVIRCIVGAVALLFHSLRCSLLHVVIGYTCVAVTFEHYCWLPLPLCVVVPLSRYAMPMELFFIPILALFCCDRLPFFTMLEYKFVCSV